MLRKAIDHGVGTVDVMGVVQSGALVTAHPELKDTQSDLSQTAFYPKSANSLPRGYAVLFFQIKMAHP